MKINKLVMMWTIFILISLIVLATQSEFPEDVVITGILNLTNNTNKGNISQMDGYLCSKIVFDSGIGSSSICDGTDGTGAGADPDKYGQTNFTEDYNEVNLTCIQITGSADLCDGNDAIGANPSAYKNENFTANYDGRAYRFLNANWTTRWDLVSGALWGTTNATAYFDSRFPEDLQNESSAMKYENITTKWANIDLDSTDDYNDNNLTTKYPNLDTDSTNDYTSTNFQTDYDTQDYYTDANASDVAVGGEVSGTISNIAIDSGIHDDEYIELADSFGGNVTGTYNALLINPCANGEILEYSANGWVCGADDTAAGGFPSTSHYVTNITNYIGGTNASRILNINTTWRDEASIGEEQVTIDTDWDIGSYFLQALRFVSDVAHGTAPFTVTSKTQVANLNVSYAGLAYDLECIDCIDSEEYIAGSIDAEHLAADVIDESKIADNGIDSEHYNDGSVDDVHLAVDYVMASELNNTDRKLNNLTVVNTNMTVGNFIIYQLNSSCVCFGISTATGSCDCT